jgi:hypothetical protein
MLASPLIKRAKDGVTNNDRKQWTKVGQETQETRLAYLERR